MQTVRIKPDSEELLFQRMETEGEGEVERRVIVSEWRVVVSEDGDRGRGGGGQQEAGAGGHSTAGGQRREGEGKRIKNPLDNGIFEIRKTYKYLCKFSTEHWTLKGGVGQNK